jgi:predicted SAM-dependent methyltransferase
MTNLRIFELLKPSLKKFYIPYDLIKRLYIKALHLGAFIKWHKLSKQKKIFLDLGSGRKKGVDGWTTVDIIGADINYDLRKGLPLKDNSVDIIYSSHMLEHIQFDELLGFISECLRVLKKNGKFKVCVPNAELYINAYKNKINILERVPNAYQPAIVFTGSFIDQINYIAYMNGQHKYLFDTENLQNILRLAGFSKVALRGFDRTVDAEDRKFESIFAEATKD